MSAVQSPGWDRCLHHHVCVFILHSTLCVDMYTVAKHHSSLAGPKGAPCPQCWQVFVYVW